MEKNKEEIPKFLIFELSMCIVFVIIMAIGIAVFANREEKVITKKENGANIVLNYSSNTNGLSIKNATPTADSVGMQGTEDGEFFDFSVDVALDNAPSLEYEIVAIKDKKNSTISDDDIKIYLEKEKSGTYTKVFGPAKYTPLKKKNKFGSTPGSMVLLKTKKTNTSTDNYRLRMWLSDKSVTTGSYSIEIVVNAIAK